MRQNRTAQIAVAGLVFPGVSALDLVGPIEAFEFASQELAAAGSPGRYKTHLMGCAEGAVRTLSGVTLHADYALANAPSQIDLLLMPGYVTGAVISGEAELLAWLASRAPHIPRVASVCSGALILARAGLLSGKRVTTHWMDGAEIREIEPAAIVEDEKIFCKDGAF